MSSNVPSKSGVPSIRLNLTSRPSSPATTPVSKKAKTSSTESRFFEPKEIAPHLSEASQVRVVHQSTHLSFVYDSNEDEWHGEGKTTLYLIHEGQKPPQSSNDSLQGIALHLRGCVEVKDVKVEGLSGKTTALQTRKSTFFHFDPIEHVLIKPAETYCIDPLVGERTTYCDADSQSSRGAAGMTNGLRAASICSWQGELRLTYERPEPFTTFPPNSNNDKTKSENETLPTKPSPQILAAAAAEAWLAALKQDVMLANGSAKCRLQKHLREQRNPNQYQARMTLTSQRLASASCRPGNNVAVRITLRFKLPSGSPLKQQHYGGLHILQKTGTPHIYTSCGTFGDHEGPRCWLPCMDSASTRHRSSHEMTVTVTAGLRQGISACGMGQDFGVSQAYLHISDSHKLAKDQAAVLLLGGDHMALLQRVQASKPSLSTPHIIPPETSDKPVLLSSDVNVTFIWCTASWAAIPIRSLGFAVGPFRFLEDAEYFGMAAALAATQDDDDEDEDGSTTSSDSNRPTPKERHSRYVQSARENGEGIRQAYFAPSFQRKHIHATQTASRALLPNARLSLRPLAPDQIKTLHLMDQAIQSATVGVPHRALSLMRDVLAVPTYRTASYLQIWIPQAVQGGCTSGSLFNCPEVAGCNPFLGGAILDARLLPPGKTTVTRLPYYHGGRVLQFLQARNCIRGWITASLPLGGLDDVGNGYIHRLLEALFVSCYERGHGAFGEGGARGGVFFTKRYSANSGLNSSNLDFLPIRNMEDVSSQFVVDGLAAAVPMDDTQNDYLWRSASNGTESHSSTIDEFNVRRLLYKDVLEVVERGTDKDKQVPSPGMGWGGVFGSYLSSTFLSSNASSSSHLGCGAVEMMHPLGGLVYRSIKMDVFRGVVEGRAGIANFIRLARASFVAGHLLDIGEKKLILPSKRQKKSKQNAPVSAADAKESEQDLPEQHEDEEVPPFVVCVNEILSKGGLTHTLFTRALQNMSGRHREPLLAGSLVDVERNAEDPRTRNAFVEPEGFPNSYVRAASMMYCRVGVQVELQNRDIGGGSAASAKSICQVYAEPIIPEGGVAFGGPITIRVVENEGQFREYEKDLTVDGSRRDWGSMALHAKTVSTPQAQAAASGSLESKSTKGGGDASKSGTVNSGSVFTDSNFHGGGYQAIELVRLTNLTPLLWVRVDPFDLYGGRISVFQQDACLAEQLFHDGDAGAQVDAIRALAERPLRIQGSLKVNVVHGVNVSELPVRLLGDCLRGSSALHSSLPHNPCVRSHAALAIGQWQNNKAPNSKNAVGADIWLGLNLLLQYFQERFYSNSVIMPVKYTRVVIKSNDGEARTTGNPSESGGANPKPLNEESYDYLDTLDEGEERATALERAEFLEIEEDEEYRVRSACVTAIASIRAQDGQTPATVTKFLEAVLEAEDASVVGNLICADDEVVLEHSFKKMKGERHNRVEYLDDVLSPSFSFHSGMLVADTLLSLCHLNVWPEVYMDPTTGTSIQASGNHPASKLMDLAMGWVEWELYREDIRTHVDSESMTVIGGNCYDVVAACAIVALANLAILKQCTTLKAHEEHENVEQVDPASKAEYYTNIFNMKPARNDLTRAAASQAMVCICCAADRFEVDGVPAVGLLSALEFLLDAIAKEDTSPSLRQTLAAIMMDACTGKVSSMQRVGSIAGRNDLYTSASRFFCGPLGPSHGGDNGSAMLTTVTTASAPAASAVNDGARRGLKLLNRAGYPNFPLPEDVVVRVAIFATHLWRIINGETPDPPKNPTGSSSRGVCAYDGALRCSLLCLWQWLWPKGCVAVLLVQSWKNLENKPPGASRVMKITPEEKKASDAEEMSLIEISRLVQSEMDRQAWRGEMALKSFDILKKKGGASGSSTIQDGAAAEQGIGQPLPPIKRDAAFKQGGWIASAAQQRRALALDGGAAVTGIRLRVGGGGTG